MATINTITFQAITNSNIVNIEVPEFLMEEFGRTLVWQEMPYQVRVVHPQDATKSITTNFAS
jgi:hypothetical protein